MRENSSIKIDLLLGRITKLWTRTKKQILDNCGLTHSQFEILSAIYHFTASRHEIIQIHLSEKTGIDPMTTSTILRNLEKKGLITRVRGIQNTRVVFVELSPNGYTVYKKASKEIIVLNKSLYRRINSNNLTKELLLLSSELGKINN